MSEKAFEPITITQEGDAIAPNNTYPHTEASGFYREQKHLVCEGVAGISRTTESHQALFCGKCGLRVTFPAAIKTYGALREHFTAGLKRSRRRT